MNATDPYEALGVPRDASDTDIRKAFRQLARAHHPDREGGDHEKMAAANRAYEILSDPERRTRYDQTGSDRGPPPIDTRAREVLCRILVDAIAKLPEEAYLAHAIRSTLRNARGEITGAISGMRRESCKLAKRRERLMDGGLFEGLFEQRARELDGKISSAETELEVIARAEELMQGVSWIGDPPGPLFTASTGTGSW